MKPVNSELLPVSAGDVKVLLLRRRREDVGVDSVNILPRRWRSEGRGRKTVRIAVISLTALPREGEKTRKRMRSCED